MINQKVNRLEWILGSQTTFKKHQNKTKKQRSANNHKK